MALPVLRGIKTENERFAGAVDTYCIEALMQDGKALQAGTSHFLGQNFAKAFDVKFANKSGKLEYVWGTSWGVSTRLMGALIMAHSDDEGLVLPPKLAPNQVVIIPIFKSQEELDNISKVADIVVKELRAKDITVKFDNRDTYKPGWKFAEYEQKGIPIRIAIGPRDLDNNQVEVARRDTKEKTIYAMEGLSGNIADLLAKIQNDMFEKASQFRSDNTARVNSYDEFKHIIENKGGFIYAHWDGTPETEEKIKNETKATIRLIPIDGIQEEGECMVTGKPSKGRVVFAKAY